jgi:hypothetical protein
VLGRIILRDKSLPGRAQDANWVPCSLVSCPRLVSESILGTAYGRPWERVVPAPYVRKEIKGRWR